MANEESYIRQAFALASEAMTNEFVRIFLASLQPTEKQ